MNPKVESNTGTARTGKIPYISANAEHSLFRNGKVLTRRNINGSDDSWTGVEIEIRCQPVNDARKLETGNQPTLDVQGFELHTRPPAIPRHFFLDHESVVRGYYPDCESLVREATGARRVAAFDHNVRSATGKNHKHRITNGQEVQGPARVVHGDYTLTSAPQRLRKLTKPPTANDTLRSELGTEAALLGEDEVEAALVDGRYAIINVWRNIADEPVATHPLALCDAASVAPEDLVVFEIHYSDRIGENYFSRPAERHNWFYWSALTHDEALLIKQWDSAGALARTQGESGDTPGPNNTCTFSFHTSFEDSIIPPESPIRWSIEVRCVALF